MAQEAKPVGEPIKMYKGKDTTTAYGPAAMGALLRAGWQVGEPRQVAAHVTDDYGNDLTPAPAMDEAPTPAAHPTKKRAGEYGTAAGTQRVVDKAKLREVKEERVKDKRDGVL